MRKIPGFVVAALLAGLGGCADSGAAVGTLAPDAVLDALLAPRQFDTRKVARLTDRAQSCHHGRAPSVNGNTDAMRTRARSAMPASISQPR